MWGFRAAVRPFSDYLPPHGPSQEGALAKVRRRMAEDLKIIVLEGDETGQELLEQALRMIDPELLGTRR